MSLQAQFKKLEQSVLKAERENLKDAKAIAERNSSGPMTLAQLRDMGHPYASRHVSPGLDPEVTNRQSQAGFANDWKTHGPSEQGGKIVSSLTNNNRVAGFLKTGTKFMVARRVDEKTKRELRPIRAQRLKDAVRKGLQ